MIMKTSCYNVQPLAASVNERYPVPTCSVFQGSRCIRRRDLGVLNRRTRQHHVRETAAEMLNKIAGEFAGRVAAPLT